MVKRETRESAKARLSSAQSCRHGGKFRGIACGSVESVMRCPKYVDQIVGSSLNAEPTQPMPLDLDMCLSYFILQGHSDLVSSNPSVLDTYVSLSRSPSMERFDGLIQSLKTTTDSHANGGFILLRSLRDRSSFQVPLQAAIQSTVNDLNHALWWIIPVSMSELVNAPACLSSVARSRVMLPICTGVGSQILCLVGHRDDKDRIQYWHRMNTSSLGWYNCQIRPMRLPPDLCHDCYLAKELYSIPAVP